jgi:two-component system LytT family response regulator
MSQSKRLGAGSKTSHKDNAEQYQKIVTLLEDFIREGRYVRRLMVGTDGRFFLIKTVDIDWIEAEGNYVRIHYGQSSALLRRTVSALEENLDPTRFLRISRSVIVNLDSVRELQRESHGEFRMLLKSGEQLSLSRHFRKRLRDILGISPEA